MVELTIKRLEDKSSPVRANAIRLVSKFMGTHPFTLDGGLLKHTVFEEKFNELKQKIEVII